jgi:hypothetical protein
VNGDCSVDINDVFFLINFLFANGPRPACNADVDNNHHVDSADVFYLINYLFAGGPEPAGASPRVTTRSFASAPPRPTAPRATAPRSPAN